MNIAVVCIGRNKHVFELAQSIADAAHTNVFEISSYNRRQVVDLLLLGFDATMVGKKKEVVDFIEGLDRNHVHNIALFSLYNLSNKFMEQAIEKCAQKQLPLMREQYCFKASLLMKTLPLEAAEAARLYAQDMINICNNYY